MKLRHMQVPPPKLAQEFELLCLDVYRMLWGDPGVQLNGRSGQAQCGVDVFGKPRGGNGYFAIQCKVKDRGAGARLTFKEIAAEIAAAEQFTPKLSHLIFATTAVRDVVTQEEVRLLSEARIVDGKFSVSVVAWEDLLHYLDQYPEVAAKYYPFARGIVREMTCEPLPSEPRMIKPDSRADIPRNELSARLSDAVDRLNEGAVEPRLSVSRIAEAMGINKLSTVARWFDGTDEPTIQFLRSFSDLFGVTFSWLLHGVNQPFYRAEPTIFGPSEAIALIDRTSPAEVIFVRSQSARGECTLILKYGEWHFHTLAHAWHVSAEVGGTGARHLVELCNLILQLKDRDSLYCSGQVLAPTEFERLVEGRLFPGAALASHHQDGDWWYALPDFEHKFPSAPNYRHWYGQSFLDAQSILRRELVPDLATPQT
jgi:transcriptional regulator with XRE-family HTH domain